MSQRLDALTVRESNGKTFWTKIGAAFPAKQGDGFTLMLDAVPASVDGQYKILLMVPKPRDGAPAKDYPGYGSAVQRGGFADDDYAPF